MATHLHRLLLLFLPSLLLFRRGTPPLPPPNPSAAVYPVVLVPGNTCSQLEARLTDAYEPPPELPQCGAGSNERGRWLRHCEWIFFEFACYLQKLALLLGVRHQTHIH